MKRILKFLAIIGGMIGAAFGIMYLKETYDSSNGFKNEDNTSEEFDDFDLDDDLGEVPKRTYVSLTPGTKEDESDS